MVKPCPSLVWRIRNRIARADLTGLQRVFAYGLCDALGAGFWGLPGPFWGLPGALRMAWDAGKRGQGRGMLVFTVYPHSTG